VGVDEPALLGVDHVQVAVPEGGEALARAFYAGCLGLTEVAKPERLAGRGGAWFVGDAVAVHVGVDADFRPARKAHVALRCRGVRALAERCQAAGAEVVLDDPMPDRDRVYVFDLHGNRLELIEAATEPDART
jgi:catechol 2,3-dioxygenase-like lactoylglutathione lyase family enzyme